MNESHPCPDHLGMVVAPQDDPAHPSPSLTAYQAFLVMSDYLWRFPQQAGEDLHAVVADTGLDSEGWPTAPGLWDDWLESVEHVESGYPPRGSRGPLLDTDAGE